LQGNTKVAIELHRKITCEHAAKPQLANCKLQKNVGIEVKVHFNLGASLMQGNLLMVARTHFAHVLKLDSTHKLARASMDMIRTAVAMEAKHESAGASHVHRHLPCQQILWFWAGMDQILWFWAELRTRPCRWRHAAEAISIWSRSNFPVVYGQRGRMAF
jgi:hypothetical protein